MWGLIQITFGIRPPHNTVHLFGIWDNSFGMTFKRQLLAGALTFCWAIWLSRNNIVFDKTPTKTFLQVLYLGTHWLRFWSQLERNDQKRELIRGACVKLETVAMQLFVDHG
jgi:hypothetical protein